MKNLPTIRDKILNLKPSVSLHALRSHDEKLRAISERPVLD